MSRYAFLALAFGFLLFAAPIARASEEYDEEEEGAAAGPDEKDVVVLTTDNFNEILAKSKYALVEFYAPWCGHCKTLKPHYAKAATVIKAYDPSIVVGKVDATEQKELGEKYEVKGYPTLKWFVNGELAMEYNGGRDEEGLVSWIKKKTGPAATTVDSVDALTQAEADAAAVVVAYFSAFEGPAYDDFIAVASTVEDVTFVQTSSSDVAAAAGLSEPETVSIIKNFKGEPRATLAFSGDVSSELATWIKGEKMPLSVEFTNENSDKIFNSGIKKQLLLWTKASDLEPEAELLKAYHAVSANFKGQLIFVTINNEGDSHEPVTNFFGLKDAVGPIIFGFEMEKNKKFRLEGDVTQENIAAFAKSMVDGTAKPEFKSAAIPEDDKDGHVQIIVGKTVETIVKDPTKDVLLEVYAPWCGHCKKLDPIYKKLAKRFAKIDSVVIAKMDGTENEHPEIEAKGYPTLILFPAGEDAKPVQLENVDRTLKGLTQYLKAHAAVPFELPKKIKGGASEGSGKDEL